MFALTLLLFTAGDAPPPVRESVLLTHVLETLTEEQAMNLQDARHRLRVVRDSDSDDAGGCVSFDCAGADDLHRTVRFGKGVRVDEDAEGFVVEARVRVILHGGWGPFSGLIELRLENAVEVP